MCNHYNRSTVAEVEKVERGIAEAVERVLGTTPAETWGWSKDQMPVVYHGEQGRTLTTMRWGVRPF